jgi:uncharacterized phosphosugar-binding protein
VQVGAREYLDDITERLQRVRRTQLQALEQAARLCARTIAAGGLVHLFGTGHGSIPALEAFPRTGSFIGWHPIVEPALGPHLRVGGEGGVHQFRFLQAAEGFGRAILDAQPVHRDDAFVLSSHSGVNPVVVEVAVLVKERGLPVVAVTSVEHSRQVTSRHSSGRRLFEVADVVIDTQAPFGDAVVEIAGLGQRVAAVSTALACAVVNALIAETAAVLVREGQSPLVLGHIDREGKTVAPELRDRYRQEYLRRLWRR